MWSYISIILSIFILIARYSQAEDIKCEYLSHYSQYYCKVLNILESDTTASNATGTHRYGKGNSDVDVLYVSTQSSTKFVPSKSCSVFKNLKKIDISGRHIKELQPNVFSGCNKVNGIKISQLSLTEINENLLSDVPNLDLITIQFTNIEVLPKNLFKNNQKLTQINLSYNKIKAISTEFPASVRVLSLQGNTCVDDIYLKDLSPKNPIINFVKNVYNKCKNGTVDDVTIDQVKAELIKERIDGNLNKILNLDEYVQHSNELNSADIEISLFEIETKKEILLVTVQNLTKKIEKFHDSVKLQEDLRNDQFTNLTEEFQILNMKVDKEIFENQKTIDNLSSKVSRENGLLIALFCFQIALAVVVVLLVYMRKL